MSDYRVVKCFGTKKVPGKEAKFCGRAFKWTSAAMSRNFGGKGVQACPYCGTMPDFQHPVNRGLNGEFETAEEVQAAWVQYEEILKNRK